MDFVFNKTFGLIFWTLFNFLVFAFVLRLILKIQILPKLKERQERIDNNISSAERNKAEAEKLKKEADEIIANAHKEMNELIAKGKHQAEEIVRKATEEADNVKRAKVAEAAKEIERSKENTIKELRKEMADIVILATEKMLNESLDKDKHIKLIDTYIEKLPKN